METGNLERETKPLTNFQPDSDAAAEPEEENVSHYARKRRRRSRRGAGREVTIRREQKKRRSKSVSRKTISNAERINFTANPARKKNKAKLSLACHSGRGSPYYILSPFFLFLPFVPFLPTREKNERYEEKKERAEIFLKK